MNEKSVDMLKKLKETFSRENTAVARFPQKELEAFIHEENQIWLKDISNKIKCYEFVWSNLIDMAVLSGERGELIEVLDAFIKSQEIPKEKICSGLNIHDEFEKVNNLRHISYKRFVHRICSQYQYQSKLGENAFQGRGVVYTVITGAYDSLKEPLYVDADYDYICYTDNRNLTSDIWMIRYVENPEGLDNVRLSRKYKILGHEYLSEYDYSIYIDGKMQIVGSLKNMVERYSMGNPMLCFPHCSRVCAYKEAEAVVEENRDMSDMITKQMKEYEEEGYPRNNGLIDAACLVRKHQDKVLQKVMECWWNEVKNKSKRDQLSIGYACWKHGFHYDLADLFLYDNEYLVGKEHK